MKIKPGLLLPLPVPKYLVGAKYVFNYNGNRYSYIARTNHLESRSGINKIILLAVFAINYRYELEKIYGYPPSAGDWPTWRADDPTAGQKVFNALIERGVKITME